MNPSDIVERALRTAKRLIPKNLFKALQPAYHYLLALIGGIVYRFPSKRLYVVGVTGTKGKSTTVEAVNAILERAGMKTAVAGTIRFKIGDDSWNNTFKMTMPGRFFLQKFLRKAADAGCTHAVIEMTSEGSKQFRYRFVYPDALIFTNISPEHIESHGSYEKYLEAKLDIARRVANSGKQQKLMVANSDDTEADRFFAVSGAERIPYSLKEAEPFSAGDEGVRFTFGGNIVESKLPGVFNIYNLLGAATFARAIGVSTDIIRDALAGLETVRGRMERVMLDDSNPLKAKQNFTVIVDYAHTADSMSKAYSVFPDSRKICVFGATGGGRDKWKRKEMGKVADEFCSEIILTDDDSYDEDPNEIAKEVATGITRHVPEIIVDRRKAMRRGIELAKEGDVVMITGKGTDAYLMGPNGARTPWNDARFAKEEIESMLKERDNA